MGSKRLKILWVKTGPLHPLDTGGKLRTYNMLKQLRKRHYVTFLTLTATFTGSNWRQKAAEYCHEIIAVQWKETPKFTLSFYADLTKNALMSKLPYTAQKYRSSEMAGRIEDLDKRDYDLIVCDFLAPAVNMNGTFSSPTLLFQHNVESQIWERYYKAQNGLLSRAYIRTQWKRMTAFEKHACAQFDGIVTVSPLDSEILRQEFHLTNILGDVPTGVDTDYFYPLEEVRKRRNHLVFTGSMDWLPNEDAVLYFMCDIYPKVKAMVPDVRLTVAGRNPSAKVKHLQKLDSSVQVTGTVQDIRPYVTAATAMVVPLRIGGGTRIKIFEGMAMGVPIISTTVGAEGLPVLDGKNIFLADDPESFAQKTGLLLTDTAIAKSISESAIEMVRKKYSWKSVSCVFESHFLSLLRN